MKKHTLFLKGILGIMLVFGILVLTGCPDGGDTSKTGEKPAAPTGVTAAAVSSSSITVSWTLVADATGYRVYRSAQANGTYALLSSPSSTSYTHIGLNASTTYYYKVKAVNSAGTSEDSDIASATTLSISQTAPAAPTPIIVAAISSNSITVMWGTVSNATSYKVYRSTSDTGDYELVTTVSGEPLLTNYTDNGLTAGTYYYKVTAVNGTEEESDYSSIVYAIISASQTAPAAPTKVTAESESDTEISIMWHAPPGDVLLYTLYRSTSETGDYTPVDSNSAFTSYFNSELTPETTYYYKVKAKSNSTGEESEYSAIVSATTFPAGGTVPAEPTGVTAVAASLSSITVNWSTVAGATRYRVYRSQNQFGTYELIDFQPSVTYYIDNFDLTPNTTYYYKVRAESATGVSEEPGSGVSAKTLLLPAPTGVTATAASSTSITVNWSTVSSAMTYKVYRSASEEGEYTQVGTSTGTSYINSGLSANTTYYYKVTAENESGGSGYSTHTSAKTLLTAPTDVTAAAAAFNSITVNWSPVTGATSYQVYRTLNIDTGTYTQVGTSTGTSYINGGLSANTTYYYKVKAVNGEDSASASAITPFKDNAGSSSSNPIDLQKSYTVWTSGTVNATSPTEVWYRVTTTSENTDLGGRDKGHNPNDYTADVKFVIYSQSNLDSPIATIDMGVGNYTTSNYNLSATGTYLIKVVPNEVNINNNYGTYGIYFYF